MTAGNTFSQLCTTTPYAEAKSLRKEISGFVTAGSNPFLQKDEEKPSEPSEPGAGK